MWAVDLAAVMGLEKIQQPTHQLKFGQSIEVNLELGSDDHIKAWLNDKKIHESFGNRSLEPRQSIVPVRLNKVGSSSGVNTSGPWGLSCRIRTDLEVPLVD